MNLGRHLFLALTVVGLSRATIAPAQLPDSPKGFDAFRLVRTRNVFDPDRRPIPVPGANVPVVARPTRADYVALTGIMVTSDKALAFFSGSRADYSKVLPLNGEIAGAKVTKITPANIEVERDGKRVNVAVGQTVPLDGSAPSAAPAPADVSAAPSDSAPTVPGDNAPNPNSPPANASDALRRMMERRQQELK